MYIDYSKLWKLLIDKSMSRTDLAHLTGLSSRVMAKLSKNETVTTDTIARICAVLDCDVGDIMEYVGEKTLSVYAAYRKLGVTEEENELYKTVRFTLDGVKYTVCRTKETATKATNILCCDDGTIYREQFYPVGYHTGTPVRTALIKPLRDPDTVTVVLIKGKPNLIAGLDENGYVSSRGTRKSSADIYVMSESAFKIFSPNL